MNRFAFLAFVSVCTILSSQAYAQFPPPPPGGPGCPGEYLFNDGTFWGYETTLCVTNINGTCTPTPVNPMGVIIYSKDLAPRPATICTNPGTGCVCSETETPTNHGMTGPVYYKPNGKTGANFSSKLANTSEFVGKSAAGNWYKFLSADLVTGGIAKPLRSCLVIKAADNPVECTGSNGPNCTPAAWFIKNSDGSDITVEIVLGTAAAPKKIKVTQNSQATDYLVVTDQ